MTRRPSGTGSVYLDADRNRWVGTYEAGWTVRGTRRRRKVYGRTEAEARRRLRDALRATETDQAATGARPTVRTWAETWLAITVERRRPETWRANRSNVTRWIIPTIGHKRLDRLTPGDVRSVAKAITDAGLTPSTARRVHAVLMKLLKDALVEGHAVPARILEVEAPAVNENDRDAIPLPDAVTILATARCRDDYSRWIAAFIEGIRPGEAQGLAWEAIDFDAGTIDVSWQLDELPYKIPHDRTSGFRIPIAYEVRQVAGRLHRVRPKTAHGQRIIPLLPPLAVPLAELKAKRAPKPGDLVWTGKAGRPLTDATDRAAFYALQDAAQVACVDGTEGRRYLPYECRHTTASLLSAAGYDDRTITAIMGHASILSSKAYIHVDQARKREAVEALAAKLGLGVPAITA